MLQSGARLLVCRVRSSLPALGPEGAAGSIVDCENIAQYSAPEWRPGNPIISASGAIIVWRGMSERKQGRCLRRELQCRQENSCDVRWRDADLIHDRTSFGLVDSYQWDVIRLRTKMPTGAKELSEHFNGMFSATPSAGGVTISLGLPGRPRSLAPEQERSSLSIPHGVPVQR